MIKKFFSFYLTFHLGFLTAAYYANVNKPKENPEKSEKSCRFEENSQMFSRKHYFSDKEVEDLLGKKIRNSKCGKIKCPIGFDNCSFVEKGEVGKIVGLQPRDGLPGYLIVVEWNNNRENYKFATLERNPHRLVSHIGNDGSFEFIED